jgi:predicted DNA-binding transcriptional regulator YafY
LRDLTDELDVSERTIQRDLEFLQEVGFPVDFEEDEFAKRFWKLPADYFTSSTLVLSVTEAISLHLAEHLLAPLAGTQFAAGLQSLLQKIRSQIPARALDYFRALDDTLYVRRIGVTDYSNHADVIETLTAAARTSQTVTLDYHSLWRSEAYTTRFDCYGLVYFDRDLFAVGHSHHADAVRVFKVTRIERAALTDDSFTRPPRFNLADHFQSTFGIVRADSKPVKITVRFDGPAAALVEERLWHESQQLEWLPAERTLFEPEPGGPAPGLDPPPSLRATFRLANTVEFKRWLKGFGAMAEILKPAWLREEMRAELEAAVERYENSLRNAER